MVGITRTRAQAAASTSGHIDDQADADTIIQSDEDTEVPRLSASLEQMHTNNQCAPNIQLDQTVSEIDMLGVHIKDAISTINQLEVLGLNKQEIPLPKIVVLGEQSTGKSSVIEAISGIKTPRSEGTCTRCALFIKLETPGDRDTVWTARLTIRRDFSYDGKSGKGHERRFPGWLQLPQSDIIEFASTENPDDLEELIGRAQLATVCPLVDPKEFQKSSMPNLDGCHRCNFSPNVVCISITAQGLPALTFYDLPGIINQSEFDGEVALVKRLVAEYINDSEALILLTCSLATDIANSTAGGIARRLKATQRCIGVLTKPDRLPRGTHPEPLRDLLDHKQYPLGHGYFVVRNPGPQQLNDGLTHDQARQQEQHFFAHEKLWACDLAQYKSRFGTSNLQNFLSRKLAEEILKSLPLILGEISNRLQRVEATLEQYPKRPDRNATRIILDVVQAFSKEVCEELEGYYPKKNWRIQWKALQSAFFNSLLTLKPTLVTTGLRDRYIYSEYCESLRAPSIIPENDTITIDSSDEEDQDATEATGQVATPNPSPKKRKLDTISTSSILHGHSTQALEDGIAATDFSKIKIRLNLDDLEEYLNSNSNSIVPGTIESRVSDDLMLKPLENWQLPVDEFLLKMEAKLRNQMHILFDKHFGKWAGTSLYTEANKIVMEMLNLNFHQQRTTMVQESLNDEKEFPYTFHDEIFSSNKEEVLCRYQQARFAARLAEFKKQREQRTGRTLTVQEKLKLMNDKEVMAIVHQEPYKREVDTAAAVNAYFMLAARRFHSSVCMRIVSKFFKQLRTQLRDELENGLGIYEETKGHETAFRLLAENSQREQQRQEHIAEKNALLRGKQILEELQQKQYASENASQPSSSGTMNGSSHAMFGMPTPIPEEAEEI